MVRIYETELSRQLPASIFTIGIAKGNHETEYNIHRVQLFPVAFSLHRDRTVYVSVRCLINARTNGCYPPEAARLVQNNRNSVVGWVEREESESERK